MAHSRRLPPKSSTAVLPMPSWASSSILCSTTAPLLVEAPAEAELVPESAKKNEPRPVRQLARAVAQPERSGIALHMRPGTNMMRAHRLGASECEGYFLVEAPVF